MTPIVPSSGLSIAHYLEHHIPFSARTFGPGHRHQGVVAHIERECTEVDLAAHPNKKCSELVDVAILGLDGAWRSVWDFADDGAQITREMQRLACNVEVRILDLFLTDLHASEIWPDTDSVRRLLDKIDTTEPVPAIAFGTFCEITHRALSQMSIWTPSYRDVRSALYGKLSRNMARTWPDWRACSPNHPIEHDRNVAD